MTMGKLQEFRAKYPEYNDIPDEQLAGSLHRKYYSDIPRDQFDLKMGLPVSMEGQKAARQRGAEQVAKDYGTAGSFLTGAGAEFSDLGAGISDLVAPYVMTGKEQKDFQARGGTFDVAKNDKVARDAMEKQHKSSYGMGKISPYIIASFAGTPLLGQGLPKGAAIMKNVLRQAEIGGALGLMHPGNPVERFQRAATDAGIQATGELGGAAASKVFGLGMKSASPAVSRVIDRAKQLGFKVLPSSGTEGTLLRKSIEGGLEATPGGALAFDKIARHNGEKFAEITGRAIGLKEPIKEINDEVFNRAFTDNGQGFNDLMSMDRIVPVTQGLVREIEKIASQRTSPLIVGPEDPVKRAVDRAVEFVKSRAPTGIPASEIQQQVSVLGRIAKNEVKNNYQYGKALFDIQDDLLGATKKTMSPKEAARLTELRNQYRNLMILSEGNVIDPVTGNVKFQTLANSIQRKDKAGWKQGKNQTDFYDAIRLLARVQPPLSSSGTAERSFMRELIKSGGIGAGFGAAGTQTPEGAGYGAGIGVASMLGAPNLMARIYLSPIMQQYLTRTASPVTKATTKAATNAVLRQLQGSQ